MTIKGHQNASWGSVTAPMGGDTGFGVGFGFELECGKRVNFFLTCEEARSFCNALHDSLLYYEEQGPQDKYKYVDRQAKKKELSDIEPPST